MGIDHGFGVFNGVAPDVLQRVDELVEEALPVASRFAPVEFRFGLVGQEEVREGRVTRAIDGNELAVTANADPPLDAHRWVGAENARR